MKILRNWLCLLGLKGSSFSCEQKKNKLLVLSDRKKEEIMIVNGIQYIKAHFRIVDSWSAENERLVYKLSTLVNEQQQQILFLAQKNESLDKTNKAMQVWNVNLYSELCMKKEQLKKLQEFIVYKKNNYKTSLEQFTQLIKKKEELLSQYRQNHKRNHAALKQKNSIAR